MTVQQLTAELESLPPMLSVFVDCDGVPCPIAEVETRKIWISHNGEDHSYGQVVTSDTQLTVTFLSP